MHRTICCYRCLPFSNLCSNQQEKYNKQNLNKRSDKKNVQLDEVLSHMCTFSLKQKYYVLNHSKIHASHLTTSQDVHSTLIA